MSPPSPATAGLTRVSISSLIASTVSASLGSKNSPVATGEFFDPKDAETVEAIKELIETRVRPAVAGDGGDITFKGFRDGVVYLKMKGACSGCPSSTAT